MKLDGAFAVGLCRPWGFLSGFVAAVLTGLGGTMALFGLMERRQAM